MTPSASARRDYWEHCAVSFTSLIICLDNFHLCSSLPPTSAQVAQKRYPPTILENTAIRCFLFLLEFWTKWSPSQFYKDACNFRYLLGSLS
ncbi:hypothetical protein IAS59_004779 [Cryptococcus gattii]